MGVVVPSGERMRCIVGASRAFVRMQHNIRHKTAAVQVVQARSTDDSGGEGLAAGVAFSGHSRGQHVVRPSDAAIELVSSPHSRTLPTSALVDSHAEPIGVLHDMAAGSSQRLVGNPLAPVAIEADSGSSGAVAEGATGPTGPTASTIRRSSVDRPMLLVQPDDRDPEPAQAVAFHE